MNPQRVEQWVISDQIRKRSLDRERINSMIEAAVMNMGVVKSISLTEQSAILIFRETYESIRQLGDAKWWLLGYEPRNHEVSMEMLKEMDITEKIRLTHLSRFKAIRNDINYRGFKVSLAQAREIVGFWNSCCGEIIAQLRKNLHN